MSVSLLEKSSSSKTFPLCDGTHVAHNKATGDNLGMLSFIPDELYSLFSSSASEPFVMNSIIRDLQLGPAIISVAKVATA